MTAYLTYIKLGAAAALLAIAASAGYHFGGLASKTALEAQHAAQLQAAVTALDTQAAQRQAAETKLQTVENAYDAVKDLPDTAAPIIAQRVLYAACPSGAPVPRAASVANGTPAAAAIPVGPSPVAAALGNLLTACDADAKRLAAVQALAPQAVGNHFGSP